MDLEKVKFLQDAKLQSAINKSTAFARQHKPYVIIGAIVTCFLLFLNVPWPGSSTGPIYGRPGLPYVLKGNKHNTHYTPSQDPIFDEISKSKGSLEIIPSVQAGKKPRWAKVAVASGFEDVVYERALETHIKHAERHGYPMYVGRENAADGMFNKIAFILHIVLQELYKPAEERIEWVFYFDADTIIMNKEIPLEIFEPPSDYQHINYIAARDWNGLNAGVLLLRVHPWTVTLLNRVMSYAHYHPGEHYPYAEQTILARLTEEQPEFRKASIYMPRPWFNAYFYGMHEVKPGMLLSHFAHPDFKWHMYEWLRVAFEDDGSENPYYQKTVGETDYPDEIKQYWSAKRRADRVIKGFERNIHRNADPIQFGLQHEETKALAEDFRQKYEDLKHHTFFGAENPPELLKRIEWAEEASGKLIQELMSYFETHDDAPAQAGF